eukprot:GDKI01021336.1.p1 GENE.GDKI01021336.1~~GDKI01021336.1.p1  ORF type:complete len:362 (-),score=72.77 GDKI01021336.1:82-1167(-)
MLGREGIASGCVQYFEFVIQSTSNFASCKDLSLDFFTGSSCEECDWYTHVQESEVLVPAVTVPTWDGVFPPPDPSKSSKMAELATCGPTEPSCDELVQATLDQRCGSGTYNPVDLTIYKPEDKPEMVCLTGIVDNDEQFTESITAIDFDINVPYQCTGTVPTLQQYLNSLQVVSDENSASGVPAITFGTAACGKDEDPSLSTTFKIGKVDQFTTGYQSGKLQTDKGCILPSDSNGDGIRGFDAEFVFGNGVDHGCVKRFHFCLKSDASMLPEGTTACPAQTSMFKDSVFYARLQGTVVTYDEFGMPIGTGNSAKMMTTVTCETWPTTLRLAPAPGSNLFSSKSTRASAGDHKCVGKQCAGM